MRLSFAEEMGVAETKRGDTQFGTEEDPCLDIVNDGFFKFEIAASKIHFFLIMLNVQGSSIGCIKK